MIPKSTVDDKAKKIIQAKLKELAAENNIRILLAIESGSRAWGFPSRDSDYDVRFIYAQTMHSYLSVIPERDVFEPKIIDDSLLGVPFDLSGWDIRKALQLALKSNPVLFEWLQSPICYIINHESVQELMQFASKVADLQRIHYHYYQLAANAWQEIKKDSHETVLKCYFYALRPALAVHWIVSMGKIPPMDLVSLMSIVKDDALEKTIFNLVMLKSTAQEKSRIPRDQIIDSFIEKILKEYTVEQRPSVIATQFLCDADIVFRHIIE